MKIFSNTNLNAIFAFLRYCLGEKEDMNRVAAGTRTPGDMEKSALLGARNRYAIRLAGHHSPRHGCAGWDRLDEGGDVFPLGVFADLESAIKKGSTN